MAVIPSPLPVAAYADALAALLPRGLPWPREPTCVLQQLLAAWAAAFARVDARGADLGDASDPRTTVEMLSDWERVFGLPDPCAPVTPTEPQRRAALLARLTALGGQSRQYFIDLLGALGRTVEIIEFSTHTVNSRVDEALCDSACAYAWQVHVEETMTAQSLTVNDVLTPPWHPGLGMPKSNVYWRGSSPRIRLSSALTGNPMDLRKYASGASASPPSAATPTFTGPGSAVNPSTSLVTNPTAVAITGTSDSPSLALESSNAAAAIRCLFASPSDVRAKSPCAVVDCAMISA
jgi:uncharacterized protein YmfQ (DUF2313 family)